MKARVEINPPLLVIRDRGNAYVLRKKIEGIHWDEAVEQLQSNAALKGLNREMKLDRLVLATARKAHEFTGEKLGQKQEEIHDLVTCFVCYFSHFFGGLRK